MANTHKEKNQQQAAQTRANPQIDKHFIQSQGDSITQKKATRPINNPFVKGAASVQRKHRATITQMKMDKDAVEMPQIDRPIQRTENKTGMPDSLKSGVESLSGIDMSDVKVHYNSDKPAQLQAHAYAQGTDIHLASGQEKHLPHEAWHVVQQKQGRVQTTTQMKSIDINDDSKLENEADAMGAKASSIGHSAKDASAPVALKAISSPTQLASTIVQRSAIEETENTFLAGALSKIKGMFSKDKEKEPPASTIEQANAYLDHFIERYKIDEEIMPEVSPSIPNLERESYIDNIRRRIQEGGNEKLSQGKGTNFCGPSSIAVSLFIKNDPLGYVKFMLALYNKGKTRYNGKNYRLGHWRKQAGGFDNESKYGGEALKDNPADQVLLSAFAKKYSRAVGISRLSRFGKDSQNGPKVSSSMKGMRHLAEALGYEPEQEGTTMFKNLENPEQTLKDLDKDAKNPDYTIIIFVVGPVWRHEKPKAYGGMIGSHFIIFNGIEKETSGEEKMGLYTAGDIERDNLQKEKKHREQKGEHMSEKEYNKKLKKTIRTDLDVNGDYLLNPPQQEHIYHLNILDYGSRRIHRISDSDLNESFRGYLKIKNPAKKQE